MTLPNERSRAILNAREFLRSLLDPKQTPKVPRAIRRAAGNVLKHYPRSFDLIRASKKFKDTLDADVFSKDIEKLTEEVTARNEKT